jgi:diguanylate cyclase (GGDEF)-like protein
VADLPFDVSASVSLQVTVSIGVALLRPGEAVEDVIRAADESLYVAKASGRNCVIFFSGR